jgi:hypothetical protein
MCDASFPKYTTITDLPHIGDFLQVLQFPPSKNEVNPITLLFFK